MVKMRQVKRLQARSEYVLVGVTILFDFTYSPLIKFCHPRTSAQGL